jgi:hypothetical protein
MTLSRAILDNNKYNSYKQGEKQEESKADIVKKEHKVMQGKQGGSVPSVAMLYIWNWRSWKSPEPFYYADFLVS